MRNWETLSIDDALEVDKENLFGEGVNAAQYSITITYGASIQFGKLLADEIGLVKNFNALKLSLVEGEVLLIKLYKVEDRKKERSNGGITNTKDKDNTFSSLRHMRQLIDNGGTKEVKERWQTMFDGDETSDFKELGLEKGISLGKSIRFSTEDTKEEWGDGLYKKSNDTFYIDLLAGRANNTGEKEDTEEEEE